jgi:hypothetical protein
MERAHCASINRFLSSRGQSLNNSNIRVGVRQSVRAPSSALRTPEAESRHALGRRTAGLAIRRALMSRLKLPMLDEEPSLGLALLIVREVFKVLNELRAQTSRYCWSSRISCCVTPLIIGVSLGQISKNPRNQTIARWLRATTNRRLKSSSIALCGLSRTFIT